MGVTLKDVALRAGVSAQAVSLVMNGRAKGSVSDETSARILQAVQETGFRRNPSARRVRCSCSETITLVMDDYIDTGLDYRDFRSSGIASSTIKGVIEGGLEKGYDVKILSLSHQDPELLNKVQTRIGEPYSDGVIFLGMFYQQELYRLVKSMGIPHITIRLHVSADHPDIQPVVTVDPFDAVRSMVRHLLNSGCRKIAYSAHRDVREDYLPQRFAGYEAELRSVGLFDEKRIFICPDRLAVRRKASDPELRGQCDAIIAMNDMMAGLWKNELEFNGWKVPGDFAVAGYDANELYRELPTIDPLRYECGVKAISELIESIREKRFPRNLSVSSVFRLADR